MGIVDIVLCCGVVSLFSGVGSLGYYCNSLF